MDRPIKILDRVTMLLIGFLNSLWGCQNTGRLFQARPLDRGAFSAVRARALNHLLDRRCRAGFQIISALRRPRGG
jgi:hypothetical protein